MVLDDVVVSRQVEYFDYERKILNCFEFSYYQIYLLIPVLQKSVNTLRSIYILHETRILQVLQRIRKKLRRTIRDNPENPGLDKNDLFSFDYRYKNDIKLYINYCDFNRSKLRQNRGLKAYREKKTLIIYYKTIGSPNLSIVGSKKRKIFYKKFRAICFKIEAPVLIDNRYLVIYRISNYFYFYKKYIQLLYTSKS